MPLLFDGTLFADYHQIVLQDEDAAEWPDDYSEAVLEARIMAAPSAIIIHTARNMDVPVRVLLHADRPEIAVDEVDHAVECGLSVPSGRLVIAGLSHYLPDAGRLAVPAGALGMLTVFEGLGSLSENGLDGADRYTIHLWPGTVQAVRVLRQWHEG